MNRRDALKAIGLAGLSGAAVVGTPEPAAAKRPDKVHHWYPYETVCGETVRGFVGVFELNRAPIVRGTLSGDAFLGEELLGSFTVDFENRFHLLGPDGKEPPVEDCVPKWVFESILNLATGGVVVPPWGRKLPDRLVVSYEYFTGKSPEADPRLS